jgi:hypothetical protein
MAIGAILEFDVKGKQQKKDCRVGLWRRTPKCMERPWEEG